jgi:2-hydroxychromene-2-carboxylate isomerase
MHRRGRRADFVDNRRFPSGIRLFVQGAGVFRPDFILNHDENAIAGEGRFNAPKAGAKRADETGAAMSRRIDYYFSLVSPWAYIGHAHFTDLARRHGVGVAYRPVLLNDVFSETGGLPLARRHPARQAYRMVELQRWRERRKLAFHLWPKYWPYDADLANCAVLALVALGADPAAFVQKAFTGIWEREENLADAAILSGLLGEAGFDAPSVLASANSPAIREAYEGNRLEAIRIGVFGAPSYVLDGEIFWGQDRLELLADMLASGRAPFVAQPRIA